MRKKMAAALLVSAFVVALAPASALTKAGGTDRPLKGTTTGKITVAVTLGLPIEVDLSGVLTHLGKYTGHFEGSAAIIDGVVHGQGSFTLAAASGDQLTGNFTFSGPPPSGEVHAVSTTLTITGGTGRFADASGTATAPLLATPLCFNTSSCSGLLIETLEGAVSGQISY